MNFRGLINFALVMLLVTAFFFGFGYFVFFRPLLNSMEALVGTNGSGIYIPDREEDDIIIPLKNDATLTGRIVDDVGMPVAGASVYVGDVEVAEMDVNPVTSEGDGSFQLTALPYGSMAITVSHREFALQTIRPRIALDTDNRVEIGLEPAGSVSGVITCDGQPLANQYVRVDMWTSGYEDVRTDASGGFRIEGLPAGTTTVVAEIELDGGKYEKTREVVIRERSDIRVDFAVTRGPCSIEGRLYSAKEAGIESPALIYISRFSVNFVTPTIVESDETGHYFIGGLSEGKYVLTVHWGHFVKRELLELRSDKPVTQDFALYCGSTVRVRVTDEHQPPRSAKVKISSVRSSNPVTELLDALSPEPPDYGQMENVEDGEAVFKGIEPGRIEIRAYAPDHFIAEDSATKQIEIEANQDVTVEMNIPYRGIRPIRKASKVSVQQYGAQ